MTVAAQCLTVSPVIADFNKQIFVSKALTFKFKPRFNYSSVRCCCHNLKSKDKQHEGFSVLETDAPWDSGSVWSTMAFYMFCLHFPLSLGGLYVIASILRLPILDPETQTISLLLIQVLEFAASLYLLKSTAEPRYKFISFFRGRDLSRKRNWLLASVIGFGFLIAVVLLTSIVADELFEPKAANNPILKEILLSGNISREACILVYCITTPLLEETVYRGFLLTSMSTTMNWQQATVLSSLIFSAAHLSGENFIQLFFIGLVLGCSYCWTGDLRSSILIHSFYNAFTILVSILS